MKYGELRYLTRRGAGVVMRGPLDELKKKLKTLRCEAVLLDETGREIGWVEDRKGDFDDKRIRWWWTHE